MHGSLLVEDGHHFVFVLCTVTRVRVMGRVRFRPWAGLLNLASTP